MKEQILGVVRHILTTGGGALVANGTMAADDMQAIVGGLVALAGVVWSVLQKRKAK